MGARHILVEPGSVAAVRLNRPDARNAMSDQTLRELTEAIRALSADPKTRVVVVRGEGKDFCAGADIEWMRRAGTLPAEQGRADAHLLSEMLQAVDECSAPVIVAAQGNVFGGGLGLLAACDIALLAADAKLCFSECRLGILPAVISCWVLPKIGAVNARRYYLTAELFDPAQAVAMGLAHEAVEPAQLQARVEGLVKNILKNGPQAVRAAKALIPRLDGQLLVKRIELAVGELVRLRSSPEGQEGLSAFLEKRPASWVAK